MTTFSAGARFAASPLGRRPDGSAADRIASRPARARLARPVGSSPFLPAPDRRERDQDMAAAEQGTPPHQGLGFAEFVAMMAALMALNALAIDSMLPALPEIGAALGVDDPNRRQVVITAYLIGFGVAQLFYGPISDIFGRKPVVMAGLAAYVVAGTVSVMATDFDQMLLARLVQGVGAAATRVICMSIVRDCYGGRRMASVMSLIMIVFIAVPVVAPSVGQAIVLFGPWRWIFGFLTLAGAFVLGWVALRLPETLPKAARSKPDVASILANYGTALTNRLANGYTLATALVMGGLFGFINSAQQIFVDVLGTGTLFPVLFAFIAIFMAISSFINAKIVGRLGMRLVSHWALIGFTAASALHAAVAYAGFESVWTFVAFQSLTMFMFGLVMSNFNAMALEPLGRIAGTASSTLGFATTVIGALLGYEIGQRFDGSTVPLTLSFAVLGAAAVAVVFVTEGGRLFTARNAQPAE